MLLSASDAVETESTPVEIAREFAVAVRHIVSAASIILFGSAARGQWHSDSDLDIYIEVPDGCEIDSIRDAIDSMAWEIGRKNGLVIQTVVYTRGEVWDTPRRSLPFIIAVHGEGKAL
jgi:predicted nucleotidyltransferase